MGRGWRAAEGRVCCVLPPLSFLGKNARAHRPRLGVGLERALVPGGPADLWVENYFGG